MTQQDLRKFKKAKQNENRPKLADYRDNHELHRVMTTACNLLKLRIATKTPFPTDDEKTSQARECFVDALAAYKISPDQFVFDDYMSRLVRPS